MHASSIQLYWAIFVFLTTAQAVQVAPFDTVQIGPYYTKNCKSRNDHIATLLNVLRHTLQPVITDLSSSTSSDAYTSFFKNIVYAPYVRGVFSNITSGVPVSPEPGATSSTPVFICVDGRDQVTYKENGKWVDAYTRCRDHGEAPAVALLQTPYIVVCPIFFTQAPIPAQSTASCLTVDPHRNRFVQNGKSLITYQVWHLLHELVHYYVYSTKETHVDIYGVNACLALLGRSAILNAMSYVYYAANIRLGCTDFPTVRTRPNGQGGGLELLEMDANWTAPSANESVALVVQSVSIQAVPPTQTSGNFDPDLTNRTRMRSS